MSKAFKPEYKYGDVVGELRARFKIVCRNCGSENMAIDQEDGVDYGGMTGYSPGHLTIGCNDCKQNDFFWYA